MNCRSDLQEDMDRFLHLLIRTTRHFGYDPLLDAVKGHRLEALYRIALSLGLRKGEILGLRWQDIDLDAGTLRIAVSLQIVGGKPILVTPKTNRSRRTLPLSPSLIAALRQHKVRQLEKRV
jgi:integrase